VITAFKMFGTILLFLGLATCRDDEFPVVVFLRVILFIAFGIVIWTIHP
jgi:hypothetical protein